MDTDYSNRFELCAEGYTLPTSPALRSHDQWDPNLNLFLSPHVLTLTVIPEGVRPPPCPNRTKHSPSLSSWCSPAFITLGWTVRVQIEWLPIQSRVVVLIMSTGSEGWQTGPYMRGQSFCSHLTQLRQHPRPSPKPESPWSSRSKVIRVITLHHTHFGKHFLLKTHTFSQIICNKYVKEYKDWLRQGLGGHNNLFLSSKIISCIK